ncbi:V-type ATP synthase subunit E [Candidatus Parvarchaeota archaeon]|nr:V-type ATP synthase subunit E [Candidatus Parvarchaeota archaeon]
MGLEQIVSDIQREGESKLKEISEETKKKVNEILSKADSDSVEIINSAKEEASRRSENIISIGKAETESVVEGMRRDAENNILKQTKSLIELKNFVRTEDYKRLLLKLVDSASQILGKDAKLYVNKSDLPALSSRHENVRKSEKEMIGGVYAESKDGKMSIDDSLETIFSSLDGEISSRILKKIRPK